MQSKSYKIIVNTIDQYEEIVSNILFESGATGVEIQDNKTLLESIKDKSNWDYLDVNLIDKLKVLDNDCKICGYFDVDASLSVKVQLKEFFDRNELKDQFEIAVQTIDPNQWLQSHKTNFTPLEFDKVIVCPEWDSRDFLKNQLSKKIVKLEMLGSFGTGRHESTAMCIELLCNQSLEGKTVVDIGCGSGILGIVAKVLGCKSVSFVDNDKDAVKHSRQNAKINGIEENCEFVCSSLLDNISKKFDLVLCNLTADLLIMLAPKLRANLEPNCKIIASGIINSKSLEVEQAFGLQGLKPKTCLVKGEWAAYLFEN